ncbi:MAG: hypothetical protein NVV73_10155 [Cellvibrionaceae bacterium]|nr:hypothetical protein [Cellvibrionaceae bacterium]
MSDFFYSPQQRKHEELEAAFSVISKTAVEGLRQYHGEWGSLAVGRSPYRGYEPYEDDRHICVVIGGPVLYFRNNSFFSERTSFNEITSAEGARAILERWRDSSMQWDEDLSGPFVVLIIDKQSREWVCVTDLLMFIPVYMHDTGRNRVLASHVDMLAMLCDRRDAYDPVSLADFVLHGRVTHPHTIYRTIYQAEPASEYRFSADAGLQVSAYWEPRETQEFSNLDEAAHYLRAGFCGYISRVTESLEQVAQFISGGEDSRVLTGALPSRLQRDAYIFLDEMNREGKIAEQIAKVYGADFHPDFRGPAHYLEILPEAAQLCGSGHEYRHAHTLGFHERHRLFDYPAVFGGFYSDTLLKGYCALLSPLSKRFDFIPQRESQPEADIAPVRHPLFADEVLSELTLRHRVHWQRVSQMRPNSKHEWFFIWPSTMHAPISNIHFTRRLFASFEPFLCKEVVKVCAAVPLQWKLNRRLFHRTFKSFLLPARWHRHSDGRLPYFSWWMNCPIRFGTWLFRAAARRLTKDTSNQGSWCNWDAVASSSASAAALTALSNRCRNGEVADLLRPCIAESNRLTPIQKVNLMQACYLIAATEGDALREPAVSRADLELQV